MSKLFQKARRSALESDIPEEGKDPSNKDADQPTDAFIEENKQKAEKPEEPSEKDEQVPAPTEEDHEVTEEVTSDEAMEQDQVRIQEEAEEVKEIGSLTVTLERLQEQLAGPQTAFSQSIIQQTIGELQTRLSTNRRSIGVENYDTTYARDDVADLKNALDAREQNLTKAVAKEGFVDKIKAIFGNEESMIKVTIDKCSKALQAIDSEKEYDLDIQPLSGVFAYNNGIKPESLMLGYKTLFGIIHDVDGIAKGFTDGTVKPSTQANELTSFLNRFNNFKYVLDYGKGVAVGLSDDYGSVEIDIFFPRMTRKRGTFWYAMASVAKKKRSYVENAKVKIKGSELKKVLEFIIAESKKSISMVAKSRSEFQRLTKEFKDNIFNSESLNNLHTLTITKIYEINLFHFKHLATTSNRLITQIK